MISRYFFSNFGAEAVAEVRSKRVAEWYEGRLDSAIRYFIELSGIPLN